MNSKLGENKGLLDEIRRAASRMQDDKENISDEGKTQIASLLEGLPKNAA